MTVITLQNRGEIEPDISFILCGGGIEAPALNLQLNILSASHGKARKNYFYSTEQRHRQTLRDGDVERNGGDRKYLI